MTFVDIAVGTLGLLGLVAVAVHESPPMRGRRAAKRAAAYADLRARFTELYPELFPAPGQFKDPGDKS